MKKSTLLIVLLAAALGGGVYYWQVKHSEKPEETDADSKPAVTFQAADVSALKIEKGGIIIAAAERSGDGWKITQPVATPADRYAIDGIVNGLGGARSSRTFPATPDRMASYGLVPPAIVLEAQLKNGGKHTIKLGAKDFSDANVYAQIDDGKDVALLPASLLNASDKPLDDLRDKSVLPLTPAELTSFALKNAGGDVSGVKEGETWRLEKPRAVRADATEVLAVLSQVGAAKMTSVVSETADDLGKYGLQSPAIALQTRDAKGGEHTLLVGKKDGEEYYARDASRPTIFKINDGLYKKLSEGFADLRNKNVFAWSTNDVTRAEIQNANQTVVVVKSGDKWAFEQPSEMKGKEVAPWKFLDPLLGVKSKEVLDRAPAGVAAQLAKPLVSAKLTDKGGKTITAALTAVVGGAVYAQTDASPEIYKLDAVILDSVNFKAADILLDAK